MNQSRSLTTSHVALAWILGASTVVSAQSVSMQLHWGRPTAPQSGACFYRDPNFRGDYFCARAGENISYLAGGMNDQISSIRTFGDTEVTIFQDQRFRGRWTRLEGDVRDLRREGWNDRLSSVRVTSDYGQYHGHYGNRQDGSGLGRIETQPWQDDHGSRQGGSGAGRYEPANPYGRDASGADRNNSNNGRDATAPGRGVSATADATVRRVYQEVLLREPDPQGLTLYRNHMSNDRWSEQDVRDALLKSPEYRQRTVLTSQQSAEQLVARAYRATLNREPDPASRVYVDKVLRERWTEADVTRELRNSPEYRSKHQ